ncbi:MAG: HAD family hydrolase [Clostridia bacterium]|nr:HAD family hydrolase [Clostridia bacterium]
MTQPNSEGAALLEKPDALILDFDKTLAFLYRDKSLLTDLAGRLCEFYRKFVPVEERLYGIDGYFAWYDLHKRVRASFGEEEALRINAEGEKIVTRFEREVTAKTPFLPGAIEALRDLKRRGVSLSIVSTNSGYAIRDALIREGIEALFDQVLGRELPFDPDKVKPSPYLIETCMRRLGLEGKTVWYAGDDVVDMEAAKRAGIVPVGVASGRHSREELIRAGAATCFDALSEVPAHVRL